MRASHAIRMLLIGGAVVAAAASATPGDRATSGCPAGQVCSPDTPEGLLFSGPSLGVFPTAALYPVASGGGETVHLIDNATDRPLALPFRAEVTGTLFQVAPVASDAVALGAGDPGAATLRITDDNGELYDQVRVESADIDRVEVAPSYAAGWPGAFVTDWAALAGGRAEVAIGLRGADDDWLIDESMQITSNLALDRTSWDTVVVPVPVATGSVALQVAAGRRAIDSVIVPVVPAIDRLQGPGDGNAGLGAQRDVCFRAYTGTALVIGVPWRFDLSGPAITTAAQPFPACLRIETTAVGTVTVTATAPGHTATATIAVSDTRARVRAEPAPPASAGDRASAVALDLPLVE